MKTDRNEFKIQIPFIAKEDKNGNKYYVSKDVPANVSVNLSDLVLMFFPNVKLPVLYLKIRTVDERGNPVFENVEMEMEEHHQLASHNNGSEGRPPRTTFNS